MENEIYLTWEVGQMAESKSFQRGFRGAWFRCKILEVRWIHGSIERVYVNYYDFPSDKPRWLKLYQVVPKKKHTELMLRPCYPPIYNAKEMPCASEISEVLVIVDDRWKVGDLVDWRTQDCYWSGTITRLLGDGKAEIELLPPPHGEGEIYVAELKDVRPSLDWCPQYGWTMPKKEGDSGRSNAWLLQPINQDGAAPKTANTPTWDQETMVAPDDVKSAETHDITSVSSQSTVPNITQKIQTQELSQDSPDSKRDSGQTKSDRKSDDADEGKTNGGSTLYSTRFDTLEASVMDLEEYLNKVKWLKVILKRGISSTGDGSRWEFVEPRAGAGQDASK